MQRMKNDDIVDTNDFYDYESRMICICANVILLIILIIFSIYVKIYDIAATMRFIDIIICVWTIAFTATTIVFLLHHNMLNEIAKLHRLHISILLFTLITFGALLYVCFAYFDMLVEKYGFIGMLSTSFIMGALTCVMLGKIMMIGRRCLKIWN